MTIIAIHSGPMDMAHEVVGDEGLRWRTRCGATLPKALFKPGAGRTCPRCQTPGDTQ